MAVQFRRILKLEQIARLEGQGFGDQDIAMHLGVTYSSVIQAKQDDDYFNVRRRILTGICSQLDEGLSEDIAYHKERIRSMLPAALDGLFELATQDNDKRLKLTACESILDREGKLAKVSRIGLPTEAQGGIGAAIDDEVANQLATVLLAARQRAQAESNDGTQDSEMSATPISTKIQ